MKSLYKELKEYNKENYYPMHMPGHKRNIKLLNMDNPYSIDITEIDGFDNLSDPKDIIKNIIARSSKLYKSMYTYLLVNGSTVGILAGIAASANKGDKVLLARNCHKSVYNAVILNELIPIYIYPQIIDDFGINSGLNPEDIENMLTLHPDIKLIIITSPTYEGIISNIKEIVKIAHGHNIPCMIDEAHGAHLGLHNSFPNNSIKYGADIVIHSLHKTLPSFTQTGLIHVNSNIVNSERVQKYLNIYQTSSPSYILMAGIDKCIEIIENNGEPLFLEYKKKLDDFYKSMKNLKRLRIYNGYKSYNFDPSKIVISAKGSNITGKELYHILLHKYKIQLEMASVDYALAMTSICDTDEGFQRLEHALLEIDQNIELVSKIDIRFEQTYLKMDMSPYEASIQEGELILFIHSQGRIAKESIYVYPPGIPIIVPGEIINNQVIERIEVYKRLGLDVIGFEDDHKEWIYVIKEECSRGN